LGLRGIGTGKDLNSIRGKGGMEAVVKICCMRNSKYAKKKNEDISGGNGWEKKLRERTGHTP